MNGQSGTLAMLMRVEGPVPLPLTLYPALSTTVSMYLSLIIMSSCIVAAPCLRLHRFYFCTASLCLSLSLSLFAILLPFLQCNFMDFKFLHVS